MGTSNFLYRDTLYALDDCNNEFIYHNTKADTLADLRNLGAKVGVRVMTADPHRNDLGYTNDSRYFDGVILARVYDSITLSHPDAMYSYHFIIGDDFCLRSGYYSGFNFDRVQSGWADVGTSNDAVAKLISQTRLELFKYDCLGLEEAIERGHLSTADNPNIADEIRQQQLEVAIAFINKTVKEIDELFHTIGERYFDRYEQAYRASSGETGYAKVS